MENSETTYPKPAANGNSKFIKSLTGHFSSALNDCSVTLKDTRYVGYMICAIVVLLVLCMVMNWSNIFKYGILVVLVACAAYLAMLVSKNTCFAQ